MYIAKNSNNALLRKAKKSKKIKDLKNTPAVNVDEQALLNANSDPSPVKESSEQKQDKSKDKKTEEENKKQKKQIEKLIAENKKLEGEVKKSVARKKLDQGEKLNNDEKFNLVGGVNGFVQTAVQQIFGGGRFSNKPSDPMTNTVVDEAVDQVIGEGDYQKNQTQEEIAEMGDEISEEIEKTSK